MTGRVTGKGTTYIPVLRNARARGVVGFILVVVSVAAGAHMFRDGSLALLMLVNVVSWAFSAYLTHKYIHKYPQRYTTYLLASHLKAALVMASLLVTTLIVAGSAVISERALWTAFGTFTCADMAVSWFRRRRGSGHCAEIHDQPSKADGEPEVNTLQIPVNRSGVLERLHAEVPESIVGFMEKILPAESTGTSAVRLMDRVEDANLEVDGEPPAFIVAKKRLNGIHRLDEFLRRCAKSVVIGGYVFVSYVPLEGVSVSLKHRYGRILYWPAAVLHFLWYQAIPKTPLLETIQYLATRRGNRALSKAETWGRLAYAGMHVVFESAECGVRHVVAQCVRQPIQSRHPSYYPIIALQKVGIDGASIYMHKLRSMYPYSEFLQRRLYKEHGLTTTGKFANDFRITRFGRFVRRYWLDELPQLIDWLRGEIKLVGMRATSPQYLGLYPRKVRDLYVRVKPGLIPPIFDESTNGFDQIVEVEYTYLRQYIAQPIRTDVAYFFRTLTDIFRRGVRGK